MTCQRHGIEAPCHVCGINRVRSALAAAPKPDVHTEPTTTLHQIALARARAEKGHK